LKGKEVRGFGRRLKSALTLIDCECIYKERGLVLHAIINSINISRVGVLIALEVVRSPGFSGRPIRVFKVSCENSDLVIAKHEVYSPLIGWHIYAEKGMVNEVIRLAAFFPQTNDLIDAIRRVSREISN